MQGGVEKRKEMMNEGEVIYGDGKKGEKGREGRHEGLANGRGEWEKGRKKGKEGVKKRMRVADVEVEEER